MVTECYAERYAVKALEEALGETFPASGSIAVFCGVVQGDKQYDRIRVH